MFKILYTFTFEKLYSTRSCDLQVGGMHGITACTRSTTTVVVLRAVREYHNLLYFDFRSVSYATLHHDFICAFFYFLYKTYEPTISSGKYSRRPFSTSHTSPSHMTIASLRPLLSLIISENE